MNLSQREAVLQYVGQTYGTQPEYLWKNDADSAVLRRRDTCKWYGILMRVAADKLGQPGTEKLEILNVKSSPLLIGSLREELGFLPAYHMNKDHWVTILLDGSVPFAKIQDLLAWSYEQTGTGKRVT